MVVIIVSVCDRDAKCCVNEVGRSMSNAPSVTKRSTKRQSAVGQGLDSGAAEQEGSGGTEPPNF